MKTFTVLFFHRSGLARLFPELSTVFGIFKLYEFLEFAFKFIFTFLSTNVCSFSLFYRV